MPVRGALTPSGDDSRWDAGSDAGPVRVDGGCAYGATLGLPERPLPAACTEWEMVLEILDGTRQVESYGNYYILARLTEADYPATIEHFPTRHWFDGEPLAEM